MYHFLPRHVVVVPVVRLLEKWMRLVSEREPGRSSRLAYSDVVAERPDG